MAIPLQYDVFARDRASRTFDNVGRSMDRVNRKSRTFGSSFAAVGATIARSATRAASVAGAALAGIGAAMTAVVVAGAAMGIKTAASLEQAQISFETLLGSARKARKFLGELTDFAARTPFQTTDVVNYSRALLGAGQAARSILPTLTAWGDASGALGQTQEQFGRTMTAVTQIMNKGKVQSEELLQISESGIPIWREMSRALNLPIPVIQELMKEGKLLSKDVLPALQAQLEKDYGGSMAKQAQTLSGLWSTFTDTLNLGLAKVVKSVLPILKRDMPGAMDALRTNLDRLAVWMRATGAPAIREFVGWLKNDLWPALRQFGGDFLAGIAGGFRNFISALGGGNDAAAGFKSGMAGFGEVLTDVILPAMGRFYREVLPALGTAIGKTIILAFDLGNAWIGMALVGVRAFRTLTNGALNSLGAIIHAADKVRFLFGPGMAAVIHRGAQGFDGFAERAKSRLNTAEQSLLDLRAKFEALRNAMYGLGAETGANYVQGLTAAMVAGTSGAVAAAQGTINKLQAQASDVLGAATSTASPTSEPKKQGKKDGASYADGVAEGLANIGDIAETTSGIASEAAQKASAAAAAAAEKATAAAQAAVDKSRQKLDEVRSMFESLRDSISDSISGWFELRTEGNPFAGLGSVANKAVRFANALAKLVKQGVNPSVIAMIAQAGPDVGLRAALMLSTAGKANRKKVNNAYERIDAAANRAGSIVSSAMYGDQLGVARSQLNELTQIRKAVTRKHKANSLNAGWSAA